MKRLSLLVAALLGALTLSASTPSTPPKSGTREVRLNGHTFTLPEGFEIELVAGPPLVDRPIVADFDDQGRLYVADSSGSNENVGVQLAWKPHRIVRLEDTTGSGKFDRAIVFADKMMFPEGVMWQAGSLYVAAPPSIWKLTDAKGDGVADRRQEWFKGKTLTNCANDLHGPYPGPDGWIYWCKGAFAQQTYERSGKPPFVTKASHIFRCRPNGSGLEPVMTGGMDNPVDVVFTPGGERIFTTTFFQHPAGGKRDGLVHAVYGGVYGKDHAVIYDHKWTSPSLMPVLTHLGPAAPAGLTRYESRVFGADYQDNLFAALFNLRKVTRHVLTPDGATFKTRDEDFVVSDNHDFHPTDVLEDADGSLLVIDTGGWYKLCCPTSQLPKPDVLGGIYRIRRKSTPKIEDPRGRKLDWTHLDPEDLAKLLDDPRPAVRRRAVETLGNRGEAALPALRKRIEQPPSVEAQRNAVWASTRIDHPAARALVRSALSGKDETVRQAAGHSISLWRDREAAPLLLNLLRGESLANRRIAAEALGRIGDRSAAPALLAAAGEPGDRFVEHALTYALIEIADPRAAALGLESDRPGVRRTALAALDQMDGRRLDVNVVARELESADAALRETAFWIVGRHPEWGTQLSGFFRKRLLAVTPKTPDRDELVGQLARLGVSPAIQELLDRTSVDATAPASPRIVALQAMARSGLKTTPSSWLTSLTAVLKSSDAELWPPAIAAVRALPQVKMPPAELTAVLLHIGNLPQHNETTRLGALAAVPGGLDKPDPKLFAFLSEQLDREKAVASRALAADILSRANLSPEQLLLLTAALKTTGPMEVTRLLEAFTGSTDEKVGLALIAALSAPGVRPGLRSEVVKPRLAKYGRAVQQQADKLYALLDVDILKQRERLEKMLPTLKDGDVRRGQAVFNNPKAACAACHTIGYVGGKAGPDLTRVGQIRNERDLLESIVFPSASFVRGYEPIQVTTKSGKTFSGVLRKDAPDEVVLAVAADLEVRIAREDIEEIQPGTVSIMPSGLDQQLTPQQLADLIAFLKACR
jgi:putative membrane-bound dehydrogenase-like protein